MTKHMHLALLCAVVTIGLLIPPVLAGEAGPGEYLYLNRDLGYAPEHPDIDGDMVVWEDDRDGQKNIYFGAIDKLRGPDSYTGERITHNSASQERPSISGDYIVWQDNQAGDWDIYLYEMSINKATAITNDPGNQWLPAIRGDYIAWYDDSSGRTEIILYDIAAGGVKDTIECNARTTIPYSDTIEFKPALSGGYVAWVDAESELIHYYDIATGTQQGPVSMSTARQSWPSLYGSLVVWEDYRAENANPDIYIRDLSDPSSEERQITSDPSDQAAPAISGEIIAWEDRRGEGRGIYIYDYSARQKEIPVYLPDDESDEHLYPAVSGNTVVWQRSRSPHSSLYIFIYSPETTTAPTLAKIDITPATRTVEVGGEVWFTATAFDQFGDIMTDLEVTWSSSNETIGTIDQAGTFTALAGGAVMITGAADGFAGTATVTVTTEEPALASLKITPPRATLDAGDDQMFVVTAFDQDNNPVPADEVIWTSSNETVGAIDQTGTFTALTQGTTTLTAKVGDLSADANITINAPAPALGRVVISPSTATLEAGGTLQLDIIAFDPYGTIVPDAPVIWESSDETVGYIEDGRFIARGEGTVTISAKGDGATGDATITVAGGEPVIAHIAVAPTAITLHIGDEEVLTATVFGPHGCAIPGVEVNWKSSDETVGTVDGGRFTAIAAGTTTVTASQIGGYAHGTVTVTVTDALPDPSNPVVISPSAIVLDAGDVWEFTATIYDPEEGVVPGASVNWKSSDSTVGAIDGGRFTAHAHGTTTITASVDGIDQVGSAKVTVRSSDPAPTRISINPSALSIAAGQSLKVTATAFDINGVAMPEAAVVWESSDDDIGIFTECALFTAIADGETIIRASIGEISGFAHVTVEPSIAIPTSIEVKPAAVTLGVWETKEFSATVLDQCDDEMGWVRVIWSCSDTEIGTLDRTGLFTAFAKGSLEVTARAGEVDGTVAVDIATESIVDPTPSRPPASSGGGGGGDTGPTFSAGICEYLVSGETFTFSDISVSSVSSVAITAANTIPGMMVTVKEAKNPGIAKPLADDIYEYFDINLYWTDSRNVGNASVTFTVPASWLESRDIPPGNITLMRYVDGEWEHLETGVVGEESGKYHFRATAQGFSMFAIAALSPEDEVSGAEAEPTVAESEPTAGEVTNVTESATTEATDAPATTAPTAPLVYAPLLTLIVVPLVWRLRK